MVEPIANTVCVRPSVISKPLHAGVPRGALKLKEAAEYLGGLSQITVRRLVDRGLLKPNRATRHLLFPVEELSRFLSE